MQNKEFIDIKQPVGTSPAKGGYKAMLDQIWHENRAKLVIFTGTIEKSTLPLVY